MSNISASSTDGGSFASSDTSATDQGLKGKHVHGRSKSPSSTSSANSGGKSTTQTDQPPKKKRNLPGTPDPNAEVVALSPKTLMATNRFICEICNKGFQRDQNLQLHRRGHNLPWKLKQRAGGPGGDTKRKVYVCPEPSCVHHDPARALGDLTGIKKHFSRKHGEKKWKCEKCSKRYAVQSDLKAHSKTCGSKEYKCDCGTLFSRKDSFITHRAFCDVLAEENIKLLQGSMASSSLQCSFSEPIPQPPPFPQFPPFPLLSLPNPSPLAIPHDLMPIPPKPISNLSTGPIFSPTSLGGGSSGGGNSNAHQLTCSAGLMSATALLQKAAQMGAAVSCSSSSASSMNSPLIQTGFVTTMAPSSFGGMIPQAVSGLRTTCLKNCAQENTSSQVSFSDSGDVGLEMVDDIPILDGVFDGMKMITEVKNGGTMTLDLLGTEGGRRRKFQEQQREEEMGFGELMENMGYFRQEAAAMGGETWEI